MRELGRFPRAKWMRARMLRARPGASFWKRQVTPSRIELQPLGGIRQRGGKQVTAFAAEGDLDVDAIKSNNFEIEWPPKGGKFKSFPEIDRAAWFDLPVARTQNSREPAVASRSARRTRETWSSIGAVIDPFAVAPYRSEASRRARARLPAPKCRRRVGCRTD